VTVAMMPLKTVLEMTRKLSTTRGGRQFLQPEVCLGHDHISPAPLAACARKFHVHSARCAARGFLSLRCGCRHCLTPGGRTGAGRPGRARLPEESGLLFTGEPLVFMVEASRFTDDWNLPVTLLLRDLLRRLRFWHCHPIRPAGAAGLRCANPAVGAAGALLLAETGGSPVACYPFRPPGWSGQGCDCRV